jgi:hypothetical protein
VRHRGPPVVLRRGSLTAAGEQTGHKYGTSGTWLRRAGEHAAALTEALIRDPHLTEVAVDAFWSLVQRSTSLRERGRTRRGPALGLRELGSAAALRDHLGV